jgi:hypothetical protein
MQKVAMVVGVACLFAERHMFQKVDLMAEMEEMAEA